MPSVLGWKALPTKRWDAVAWVLSAYDDGAANNLSGAVPKLRLAWTRLGEDLERFFIPSGPPGTHAYSHYHPPVDPDARRELVDACVVDYESALLFLDVALDATARGLAAASGLSCPTWKRLVALAEGGRSLSPQLAEDVLYLHRTVLWARNKAIAHPKDHLLEVSWDAVGNLSFWRLSPAFSVTDLTRVDQLLHRVRPDIPPNAQVGQGVPVYLALTWIGTCAGTLSADDRRLFEDLRSALGYQLPPPHEIADAVSRFLEGVVTLLPTDQRGHLALLPLPASPDPLPRETHRPDHPLEGDAEISAAYDLREAQGLEAAMAALEPLVDRLPDSALLHIAMADVLTDLKRYEDAIVHCRLAGAVGWPVPGMQPKLATCHFNLGAAAYGAGDMTTAARHYREVTRLQPRDTEARAHLAVALARLGDRQGAMLEADRILNGGETLGVLARLDLGIVLRRAEQWQLALEQFDACLAEQPTSIPAMGNRAGCLAVLGRADEGRGMLEDILQRQPSDIPALQNLARLLRQQGENAQAVEILHRLVGVAPGDEWARTQLTELAVALPN